MPTTRLAVALQLVLFLACGTSQPPVSGSGGGSVDAGTVDAGAADAGAADAGTVDAGGGPTDAGPSDAGPGGDGGASGPGDAGTPPDGGVAANECDGLIPPGRPPLTLSRGVGSHSVCMGATTNSSGSTLGIAFGSSAGARVALEPIAGGQEFAVLETRQPLNAATHAANMTEGLLFFPQPSGYQSTLMQGAGFATYSETGERLAFESNIVVAQGARDPAGGTAVAFFAPQPTGTPPLMVARFDANGVRRVAAAVVAQDASAAAIGITPGGWTLVLYRSPGNGTTVLGRWFDVSNAPQGTPFVVTTSQAVLVLRPLADGRLALRVGDEWVAVFGQGEQGSPPPDWLSSRPGTSLFVVEGGRAYALPASSASACVTQTVEIVAVSGKKCGEVSAPPPSTCRILQPLDIGPDGTLAQSFETPGGDQIVCGLQWWPGLLR